MPTNLAETLSKLCYEAGQLVVVDHAAFEGDASFIRAIRLTFESLVVVFRAVGEDDTIAVVADSPFPELDETLFAASDSPPWSPFLGCKVSWAWMLTNQ